MGPYALPRLHAVLVEQHEYGKQWQEQTPLWRTLPGMLRQQQQEKERKRRHGGGIDGVCAGPEWCYRPQQQRYGEEERY